MTFIMMFVGELAGASSGIGYRISMSNLAYRADLMFASLFCLGLWASLIDGLFVWSSKQLLPWM
jgi:ABC-type nitrate/sulfonate/bicarbonate transport system permease component